MFKCEFDEITLMWVCSHKTLPIASTDYELTKALKETKNKWNNYGKDKVVARTDYDEINE